MPAQWPTFVTSLTNKLLGQGSKGPTDIGRFVAGAYFNAVSTSQTYVGNIHTPGQRAILDAQFIKAFIALEKTANPTLQEKFGDPLYEDMFEEFPAIDLEYDSTCDFEKWVSENDSSIKPFIFYQLFNSTCPTPSDKPKETGVYGDISINLDNINDKSTVEKEIVTAKMKVLGSPGKAPYKISYSLNLIEYSGFTDSQGVLEVVIPTEPGEYSYVFNNAEDSDGVIVLDEVNKRASIKIDESGEPPIIKVDKKKPRQFIPQMNRDEIVDNLAKRILSQNDGTDFFKRWLTLLDYGKRGVSIEKEVKTKVLTWLEQGKKFPSTLNTKLFQEEHRDNMEQIPRWVNADYIIKFTYDPSNDNYRARRKGTENTALYRNYIKRKQRSSLALKKAKYETIEKPAFVSLKKRWTNELKASAESTTTNDSDDPFITMANGIIQYWQSTTTQPFTSAPIIPLCNLSSPGTYVPISYGDKEKLANELRRAWNTGKQFKIPQTREAAANVTATAMAVACANHLKSIKFVYIGQLNVGTVSVPMGGFVPFVF